MSRVMLALKVTVEEAASGTAGRKKKTALPRTLVFDEIDIGIGGRAAEAVGRKLKTLSKGQQVLCITHLPQIASLGYRHFSIVKDTRADPTRAEVVQLDEGDVVAELVRMLGADSDDIAARRHARDLRRAA